MKHSSTDFAQLLRALSNDIVDAHIHWQMACDLAKELCDHPLVAAQSRTFWSLTHKAHVDTALQCLARAFDQEQSSLHLLSWLQIIRANRSIFDVEEFRHRLRDNAFVESLAESAECPDPTMLEQDISLCRRDDSAVKMLSRYRGSRAAHRSLSLALKPQSAPASQLNDHIVELLLERAKTIFNRYSYMFSAEIYSTLMPGRDDYKYIFSAVDAAVHSSRSRM